MDIVSHLCSSLQERWPDYPGEDVSQEVCEPAMQTSERAPEIQNAWSSPHRYDPNEQTWVKISIHDLRLDDFYRKREVVFYPPDVARQHIVCQ